MDRIMDFMLYGLYVYAREIIDNKLFSLIPLTFTSSTILNVIKSNQIRFDCDKTVILLQYNNN